MLKEKGGVRWVDGRETRSKRLTCGASAESRGCFSSHCALSFILEGIALVISFEEVWGVNVLDWFPGVVTFGVPFPLHKVLERSRPPMASVIDQVFHFVFFGSLN